MFRIALTAMVILAIPTGALADTHCFDPSLPTMRAAWSQLAKGPKFLSDTRC